MRLLIVTQVVDRDHSNLGFFHEWIEEFAAKCARVHVVCLQAGSHALPANVSVHSLGKEIARRPRLIYAYRFLRLIVALRHEYDAVLVHMNPEYVVLGGLMWRAWGKTIALWYMHKRVSLALRIAVRLAHVAFTASKESLRIDSPKRCVVGHGISSIFFVRHTDGQGMLRIATIGRISENKRLIPMLEAIDEVHAQKIPFTFTIVGSPLTATDQQYEKQLRGEIQKRSYRDNVRVLGAMPHRDLPRVLVNNDLFLNMSGTGSLDKAVLEALASGARVITSNEAFKDVPGVSFVSGTSIVEAIQNREGDAEAISAYVRQNHALERLVGKILERMASLR